MSKPREDKNIKIPLEDLVEFLTAAEIRMLKNRWQIAKLLQEGHTVRSISEIVKVGTDTVVRVSKMIEGQDFRGFRQNRGKKIKTNTPWIFGKSE